jgi:deoxyribonuclease-2
MQTYCKPTHAFNVWNVQNLSWGGSINYKETKEHSKWAVATGNGIEPIVCIGDINRMTSQALRGGGTTCMSNQSLWRAMTSLISSIEACPTKGAKPRAANENEEEFFENEVEAEEY